MTALHAHFRPEFLNRLDDTVLFKPLSEQDVATIAGLFLAELKKRLADQQVLLELNAEAALWLGREGYDPVFGARPLKRFIQQQVETPVARLLIAGSAMPGSTIRVEVVDGGLKFVCEPAQAA
jgi:ATP-dependent Clp protease ATP-binding subunit ClpB